MSAKTEISKNGTFTVRDIARTKIDRLCRHRCIHGFWSGGGGGAPSESVGATFGQQNLSGGGQIIPQGRRYSHPGGRANSGDAINLSGAPINRSGASAPLTLGYTYVYRREASKPLKLYENRKKCVVTDLRTWWACLTVFCLKFCISLK